MKRRASSLIGDSYPMKKRRIEEQSPDLAMPSEAVEERPNVPLPPEIWHHIVTLNEEKRSAQRALRDQKSLAFSSKIMHGIIMKIWHENSSKKWPTFYSNVMKHMNSQTFIQTYIKLRKFSEETLEVLEGEEFDEKHCPLCDNFLDKSGEFGEIMTCSACVKTNGEAWKIEWRLDYETINCHNCNVETPFKFFECGECGNEFCFNCKDRRFRWPVYGAEDTRYCVNCAVDCEHCADWAVIVGNNCYRCKRPQCARCDKWSHCDNDSVSSDSNSDNNDFEDNLSDEEEANPADEKKQCDD